MNNILLSLSAKELLIAKRNPWQLINPLIFFIISLLLFPLAIGPDPRLLQHIAPGVIWVLALLSLLLNFEQVFGEDFADGSLDFLLLSPNNLPLLICAKIFSHWLISIMPLLILTLPMGLIFTLPIYQIGILELSLLLGTPVIFLLGSIIAGLVVGLRNNSILLALLVLPLCIPILIFGTSIVSIAADGLPVIAYIEILTAIFILALCLCPWLISAALKIGSNQ